METLGEGYGDITIYAHNLSYTKRLANHAFLGASGMAFGLLWSDEMDYRTMDLTQIIPLEEVVRRIFAFVGYTYELFAAGEYDIEAAGYHTGYPAFAHWINAVSAETVDSALYAYHKALLFNYAELPCMGIGLPERRRLYGSGNGIHADP